VGLGGTRWIKMGSVDLASGFGGARRDSVGAKWG
jgi:hypothetical protein